MPQYGITTPGGHASVWGLGDGWVDFLVLPSDARIADLAMTNPIHVTTTPHRLGDR